MTNGQIKGTTANKLLRRDAILAIVARSRKQGYSVENGVNDETVKITHPDDEIGVAFWALQKDDPDIYIARYRVDFFTCPGTGEPYAFKDAPSTHYHVKGNGWVTLFDMDSCENCGKPVTGGEGTVDVSEKLVPELEEHGVVRAEGMPPEQWWSDDLDGCCCERCE